MSSPRDTNSPGERAAWEQLPPDVARALLEAAERIWNGDGAELRFWRADQFARIKRMPPGETTSVRISLQA